MCIFASCYSSPSLLPLFPCTSVDHKSSMKPAAECEQLYLHTWHTSICILMCEQYKQNRMPACKSIVLYSYWWTNMLHVTLKLICCSKESRHFFKLIVEN